MKLVGLLALAVQLATACQTVQEATTTSQVVKAPVTTTAGPTETVATTTEITSPQPPTTVASAADLVPFVNEEDGYSLLLPESWVSWPRSRPGVRTFGEGSGIMTYGWPALAISIGDADGAILLCLDGNCGQEAKAVNLVELEAAMLSVLPDESPWKKAVDGTGGSIPAEVEHGDDWAGFYQAHDWLGAEVTLDGGQVRFLVPELPVLLVGGGHGCLGCAGKLFVLSFQNERPVVLAFEWWNIEFDRLGDGEALVADILQSFRFLDE
jgi:hypothetical protein